MKQDKYTINIYHIENKIVIHSKSRSKIKDSISWILKCLIGFLDK